ncbi:MAG: B12-binding domain-containing protein, partial [Acetobacterium sp.]|nr:B12-binding domain-containing protein [Bacillota bacterium]MCG2731035.1 B12-binding domain-containing protein [Acetobacterium sp.]
MSKIQEVKEKVEIGKTKLVPGLVQEALDEGNAPGEILQAMVESMSVVGEKFSSGEIFVPEMLIAAKAMSKGVDVLRPLMAGDTSAS